MSSNDFPKETACLNYGVVRETSCPKETDWIVYGKMTNQLLTEAYYRYLDANKNPSPSLDWLVKMEK